MLGPNTAPETSDLDKVLELLRLVSDPVAVEDRIAEIKAAAEQMRSLVADANEAIEQAEAKNAEADRRLAAAKEAEDENMSAAATLAGQEKALVAKARALEEKEFKFEQSRADWITRLDEREAAIEREARARIAQAKAREDAANASQTSAYEREQKAAEVVRNAEALRSEYQAKLNKFREMAA